MYAHTDKINNLFHACLHVRFFIMKVDNIFTYPEPQTNILTRFLQAVKAQCKLPAGPYKFCF